MTSDLCDQMMIISSVPSAIAQALHLHQKKALEFLLGLSQQFLAFGRVSLKAIHPK